MSILSDPAFYVGIWAGVLGGFFGLALIASHPRVNDDEAQIEALRLWREEHREAEVVDMHAWTESHGRRHG